MSQISLLDDGHVAKLARDREHEVDRTPGPVVHQGLMWFGDFFVASQGRNPNCIVDVGAGAGVFGQQERIVFGDHVVRIGVELRAEESDAARHYDRFIIGDALDPIVIDQAIPSGEVDATIANPKFSIWSDLLRVYLPRSRFVMFYGTIAWGCAEGERDDEGHGLTGAELFKDFPPLACGRVVGRIAHRGPGLNPENGKPWGADQRDNCWWLWERGNANPRWETENLPPLTNAQRRWTVVPGSEP